MQQIMNKCWVVIIVLNLITLLSAQAYANSVAEQEKLEAAHRVAARVFKKTKNADGAVKVLEEAGIALIVDAANALNDPINMDILEAYTKYLSHIENRQSEAAGYLTSILKKDPSRVSAYLNLGDLYYRRHKKQANAQYRRIYVNAYKKYVSKLIEQDISVLLPDRIFEAVYSNTGDVCGLLREVSEQKSVLELLHFLNPETGLKEKSEPEIGEGASLVGLFKTAEGPVHYAEIDIDNDGSKEQHYSATIGNGCQRNLFYKEIAGELVFMSNFLFDKYYQPERICGGSSLLSLRFKDKNYLIERQVKGAEQLGLWVFEILASGQARQLCQIATLTELQANLSRKCDAAICERVANNIDKIVAAEGQAGVEWLVSNIAEQRFSSSVKSDMELAAYISSPHQYLIDLDNDGQKELIARLWWQTDQGLQYGHRLFKSMGGQWSEWQWPVYTTDAVVPEITSDSWFFVESLENTNYIISYIPTKSDSVMQYTIHIFNINAAGMHYLGEVESHQEWVEE